MDRTRTIVYPDRASIEYNAHVYPLVRSDNVKDFSFFCGAPRDVYPGLEKDGVIYASLIDGSPRISKAVPDKGRRATTRH